MKYFNLHANCIPVLGAKNAILCDLFRERYLKVPREIASLFKEQRHISLDDPLLQETPDFGAFLGLLEQDDWGHYTSVPLQFPPLNLQYDYNGKLSNCIIDIEDDQAYPVQKVVEELNTLDCQAVQVRFYKAFDLTYIRGILQLFQDTTIRYVEVLLQYHGTNYSEPNLKSILQEQVRLKNIYIFSAPKDEIVTFTKEDSGHKWRVIYSSNAFQSEEACGKISSDRFTINLINFTEANNFNSCLNCKIGIDKKGNIRNCPSFKNAFGNISTTSLKAVAENETFRSFFSIKKDDVDVCKDCEYRYVCTDCRVYTTDERNPYAKPAKCTYDPYIGVWN